MLPRYLNRLKGSASDSDCAVHLSVHRTREIRVKLLPRKELVMSLFGIASRCQAARHVAPY
jgi:hypothetical protein